MSVAEIVAVSLVFVVLVVQYMTIGMWAVMTLVRKPKEWDNDWRGGTRGFLFLCLIWPYVLYVAVQNINNEAKKN